MNLITIVFFIFVTSSESAKILAIIPTPFFSHQSVFHPLWQVLVSRNHNVTLISTNPIKDSKIRNIDLSFTYELIFEKHQMQHVVIEEKNLLVLMKHVFVTMNNMTEEQLNSRDVQELLQSDEKFDLMVVEAHVPAWFALVKKYNCPIIAVSSMDATNHWKRIMGNLNNPVFTPHYNLPFEEHMSFLDRVISTLFEILDEAQLHLFLYPTHDQIVRKILKRDDIDVLGLQKSAVMMFTQSIPGFGKAFTRIPSILQLNSLQITEPKLLPDDLQLFLDNATSGAIYFSLGSLVKSIFISNETKSILLAVFEQLPYKVIWKVEGTINDPPKNVKIVSWAPQQDILRHKNVKLFIMQGGIQSIDEAIRFQVPLLVFPFIGDMVHNSKRVKHLNIGTWMNLETITIKLLKNTILEAFGNESYVNNMKELNDLMDPPAESLAKAVWWVEHVLKYDDIQLRSPLSITSFYQYYLIDVLLFLLTLSFGLIFLSVKLIRSVCSKICYKKLKTN